MVSIIVTARNLDFLLIKVKQGLATDLSWCLNFRQTRDLQMWRPIIDRIGAATNLERGFQRKRLGEPYTPTLSIQHDVSRGTITLKGLLIGTITTIIILTPEDHVTFPPRLMESARIHSIRTDDINHVELSTVTRQTLDIHGTFFAGHSAYTSFNAFFGQPACLFVTDSGVVGAAARKVVKKDTLSVLFGCKLPLVLRRQENSSYRVVDAVWAERIEHGVKLGDIASCLDTEFVLS